MAWKTDALKHAKEQHPREACGLVVIIKGKRKYWPCENIAANTEDLFVISP